MSITWVLFSDALPRSILGPRLSTRKLRKRHYQVQYRTLDDRREQRLAHWPLRGTQAHDTNVLVNHSCLFIPPRLIITRLLKRVIMTKVQ